MADALVSAIVSTILGNINSLWLEELGITGDLKTELGRMRSTLSTIQAVLMDAEEKQWKSEAIKDWLGKLKDAAYDVEDILDDVAANTQRRSQVNNLFSLPKQLVFRSKMAHKLKDIREKLDAIAGERSKFHLREAMEPAEDREVSDGEWRQTSSLVNEEDVYGRGEELDKVTKMVLDNLVDGEGVFVYTICGMGGLGKTTLSQLIYNNEKIVKAFDFRGWVCVSNDFDVKRLTKDIIESVGGICIAQQLDPLQRQLQEKLAGKRFFLVLDDVWNEDEDKWERLKLAFRFGGKGSAVVVTTRIEKVALMMSTTSSIHHLGCLSHDDSWTLFMQHAFRRRRSEDYSHLEALGREIVKKCGGVPLAIKTLGGLLRFKQRESEWLSVKESKMWQLEDGGKKIFEVLKLSYRHLKPYLRRCFSFCSVFPKDTVMVKEQLIQLWMANGFIPSKGQLHLHDIGSEVFNELAQRSFFQDLDIKGYGTCKMHDLIHDLAQLIMGNECCVIGSSQLEPKAIRHMSAFCNSSKISVSDVDKLLKISSLRSLLVNSDDFYLRVGAKQKHLRALEILCIHPIREISFDNFRHLRYLKFYNFTGETLPDSICSLHNLQTLKLTKCHRILMLPKSMKCLKNLMYLDIRGCHKLTCMPVGLRELSCLRVLGKFIVGKEHGCFIEEMKELALEGELQIEELQNVKCSTDARSANLEMKPNLRWLGLCWRENNLSSVQPNDEEVLSGLQPHSNLKELIIYNYQGPKFSNWLMDLPRLVPNLVNISLQNCDKCECLPPLGKLQFLKHLEFSGMHALKCIDCSFYGDGDCVSPFQSLEELVFCDMPSLEVWKVVRDGSENFPLLGILVISECPKLGELPMLPSLKRLQVQGVSVSLLGSVMIQASLKSLVVIGCQELESLTGLEKLSSLELLKIDYCNSLLTLPENGLHGLSSLTYLCVQRCEKFCSLSNGLGYLTSLQDLSLNGCPQLKSLTDSIQHLSALQSLRIYNCDGLTSLPNGIQNLALLSVLMIEGCSNIMFLPQGLSSLTALKNLTIVDCQHLQRRCKRDTGEDWPIIAHISNLTVMSNQEYYKVTTGGKVKIKITRIGD